jgi:hypothetical protein
MAVTAKWYPKAFQSLFDSNIKAGDTFKIALFDGVGGVYNDAHSAYSDLFPAEISGTGYSTGGAVTNLSLGVGSGGDSNKFLVTPTAVTWTSATFAFQYAALYSDNAVTGKKLLLHIDFGTQQNVAGQEYQINVPSPLPMVTT